MKIQSSHIVNGKPHGILDLSRLSTFCPGPSRFCRSVDKNSNGLAPNKALRAPARPAWTRTLPCARSKLAQYSYASAFFSLE